MGQDSYVIAIDTGGTFTDCMGCAPDGRVLRCKVLSTGALRARIAEHVTSSQVRIEHTWPMSRDILTGYTFRLLGEDVVSRVMGFDPEANVLSLDRQVPNKGARFEITAHEEAPLLGIRLLTETALDEAFPPIRIRLGTTRATNALLERKGAPMVCVVTQGFGDVFRIGTQQRPDLFALPVIKPEPLCDRVLELDERMAADGTVLKAPDVERLREPLAALRDQGLDVAAGALIHAWTNPAHEHALRDLLMSLGFRYISLSSALSRMMSFFGRAQTAVVNAYLTPVIHDYIDRVHTATDGMSLRIMTSAGGLVRSNDFRAVDSLLSGPAGGCVGAAAVARELGYERIIAFDMGGTSTDVSRYEQGFAYRYESTVAGVPIFAPALHIETVAAGGGSICGFDGYKLTVGPDSAGADPGPACYGAGGPLCITDINLLAGRLVPDAFGIPVYPEQAQQTLERRLDEIAAHTGQRPEAQELIRGYLAVADEKMAGAIKTISMARGYEAADYALAAFGGAGGMHACAVASLLGIRTVLLPTDAGLLSAYGLTQAQLERFAEQTIAAPWDEVTTELPFYFDRLRQQAVDAIEQEETGGRIACEQWIFLRFTGQSTSLALPWTDHVIADFRKAYKRQYGHWIDQKTIEVETLRVIGRADNARRLETEATARSDSSVPEPVSTTAQGTPVYFRDKLSADDRIDGPALLLDSYSTAVVDEGWRLQMHANGTAVVSLRSPRRDREPVNEQAALELYANRFMHIAESMGAQLQRTACSVNVKDRLDFSCAVLDAQGHLVANAPHIPVHLGGLGLCARRILAHCPVDPGDVIVANHPGFGGSHLPDVTVLTGVFLPDGMHIGYVINRAHHAEIGGTAPGSMPPLATRLSEEGVIIKPFYLIRAGKPDWQGMRDLLERGPWPSRAVQENLADLNAQLAANQQGLAELRALAEQVGPETVQAYFDRLRANAEGKVREVIARIEHDRYVVRDRLDDGTALKVTLSRDSKRNLIVDFTGTDSVHPYNFNATEAVCHSVVMYWLRVLVDEPVPLNDGMLDPVTLVLPICLLHPDFTDPATSPAVSAGNVEVSQRLTDILFRALGITAAGQGTMNNLLFGDDSFGYYETLGGGCGGVEGCVGASAVHQHMTNTRMTDVEILEYRYPVRVQRFAVRYGSGGRGRYPGGDGMIRELVFLKPVSLAVITQRRKCGPPGLNGGGDGKPGSQRLILTDGKVVPLRGCDIRAVDEGTTLVMETPGGGAMGKA